MMSYSLSYFKDAKLDAREAKVWYREQQPGLEKRFAGAVKTGSSQIVAVK
jgi:hypothetical protein